MSFDIYTIPMNIVKTSSRIHYTVDDVFRFLRSVERAFGLPYFTMTKKNSHGRANRLHGDLSLSEIRKAIIWHLFESTDILQNDIARGMHLNHATVHKARTEAESLLHVNDQKFMGYYIRVINIPLLCD